MLVTPGSERVKTNKLEYALQFQALVSFNLTDMLCFPSRKYFLKRIHKVLHNSDPVHGDRYSVDLELGLHGTNQLFRLSEHVFGNNTDNSLCFPRDMNWN